MLFFLALELGSAIYMIQNTPVQQPFLGFCANSRVVAHISADLKDLDNYQKELVKRLSQISK